jgi:hypothetical protein
LTEILKCPWGGATREGSSSPRTTRCAALHCTALVRFEEEEGTGQGGSERHGGAKPNAAYDDDRPEAEARLLSRSLVPLLRILLFIIK